MVPVLVLVLVSLLVWAGWEWSNISQEFSVIWLFPGPLALTAIALVILLLLCSTKVIWPPRRRGSDYTQWAAECEASSARATTLALFIAVIGGTVAWGSLRASLLSLETGVPEMIRADGVVLLCVNDLRQSSATMQFRSIGGGRARITELGLFIKTTVAREREFLSFPFNPVIEIGGDATKTFPDIQSFNSVFGPTLADELKKQNSKPEEIELISVEIRYTDVLNRSRHPRDKLYKLDPERREC